MYRLCREVASFPGRSSILARGRKGPGNHCLRMHKDFSANNYLVRATALVICLPCLREDVRQGCHEERGFWKLPRCGYPFALVYAAASRLGQNGSAYNSREMLCWNVMESQTGSHVCNSWHTTLPRAVLDQDNGLGKRLGSAKTVRQETIVSVVWCKTKRYCIWKTQQCEG